MKLEYDELEYRDRVHLLGITRFKCFEDKVDLSFERIQGDICLHRTMITTVVNGLKMEYPIVYAHLRYDEIRP